MIAGRDPETPDIDTTYRELHLMDRTIYLTNDVAGATDAQALDMVVAGVRGISIAGAADEDAEFSEVSRAMDTILDEAGSRLQGVVGAIALSSVQVDDFITRVLGTAAADRFAAARRQVGGFFRRIVRKGIDVLEAAVTKVAALFGADDVGKLIHQARAGLSRLWEGLAGGTPAGTLLGLVLDGEKLRAEYRRNYDMLPPSERAVRLDQVRAVVRELTRRLSFVGIGVSVLAWVRTTSLAGGPAGLIAIELVGVALAAYVFWSAHDHLDALSFTFLPDRAIGLGHALTT